MNVNLMMGVVVDVPLTPFPVWPFLIAVLAGIVFGALGRLQGKAPWVWGIGGAIFGLVTAATASGFATAVAVPYTDAVRSHGQFKAGIFSVLIIAVVAILLGKPLIKGKAKA